VSLLCVEDPSLLDKSAGASNKNAEQFNELFVKEREKETNDANRDAAVGKRSPVSGSQRMEQNREPCSLDLSAVLDSTLQPVEQVTDSPEVRMVMPHNTPSHPSSLDSGNSVSPNTQLGDSNVFYKLKLLSDIAEDARVEGESEAEEDNSMSAVSALMSFQSPSVGEKCRNLQLDVVPSRFDCDGSLTPESAFDENFSQAESTTDTVRLHLSSPLSMASVNENHTTFSQIRLLHDQGRSRLDSIEALKMPVIVPPHSSSKLLSFKYPVTSDMTDSTPSGTSVQSDQSEIEQKIQNNHHSYAMNELKVKPGKKMTFKRRLKKTASLMLGLSKKKHSISENNEINMAVE